ncbi:MAG: alpha/beta fold hydrolase [Pleurocapsa sp.]
MSTNHNSPDFLLFAQHGWADRGNDLAKLARALATPNTHLIVPSLGIINTFISIKILVKQVEQLAEEAINNHPETPLKIIGHSMGGLIWLEVLQSHPEWWHKVHSLVTIGSPIGGSDVARIIDPFNLGISTARDLGKNRRLLAEKIAQHIPTLSIASDVKAGSDGLVTVECSKFAHSKFVLVLGIPHAALKCHPQIVPIIQDFWANPRIESSPNTDLATKIIRHLQSVPGMTDASYKALKRSQVVMSFTDGISLRIWKNPVGVTHVFVTDQEEKCLYAGYVGWLHTKELSNAIAQLQRV